MGRQETGGREREQLKRDRERLYIRTRQYYDVEFAMQPDLNVASSDAA